MTPNILAGLIQSIANAGGDSTPNPLSSIPSLSSDGIESRFGVGGTSLNYVARPKILARLTDKDFSLPGAYSFKQIIWNREDQRSFIDADYGMGLRGEWNTGNSGVAKERNGFAGMHVGEDDGSIVQIELDDDNETWWFDHNLDSYGGNFNWEDTVIDVTTGPGTGTGTGTGSGDESGGLVINIHEDALVIVTGNGGWIYNVPVTFLQSVKFTDSDIAILHLTNLLDVCGWMSWCFVTIVLDGDKDNWIIPSTNKKVVIRIDNGGANRTITGMIPGCEGQVVCLLNVNGDTLTLSHNDAASSDQYAYLLPDTTNLGLAINEGAIFWYDNEVLEEGGQGWRTASIAKKPSTGTDDRKVLVTATDTTAAFLGAKLAAGSGIILSLVDSGANEKVGISTTAPTWVPIVKTYDQLAAASTTNNVEVYSLLAGWCIHGAVIKHSTAFTGGAIASYTASIGYSSSPNEFTSNLDVFSAPSGTGFAANASSYNRIPKPLNFSAAESVRVYLTSSGANLNAATAGSLTVWLLVSALP